MVLDSTSKHHTVNMRLLLITLICLATALALPHPKQKRDILPGDPRYGTEHHHHHHHENAIDSAKSVSGYSYTTPKPPNDVYGPPGFVPGTPLHNDYLPPLSDSVKFSTIAPSYSVPVGDSIKFSTVAPSYGVPIGLEVRVGSESVAGKTEVKKTLGPVAESVVKTETVSVTPPSTSYGIPLDKNVKTLGSNTHTHVSTRLETTKTELHPPPVKVVEHAPVVQELPSVVKTPVVTTLETKNVVGSATLDDAWSNLQTTYGGTYGVPSFDYSSYFPSSFYSNYQPSYDTLSTGFSSSGLNRGFYVNLPQTLPLSLHVAKTIPATYAFPQTVEIPKTGFQVPQTLTHLVQQVPSVQTFESLPSLSSYETFSSVQPAHSLQTIPTVYPGQQVESVPSVSSVKTVSSVHPVQSVQSVQSVSSVHPVHSVESVSSVHPVQSVESVSTVHPVHHVETVTPVQPVPSVETLTPVHPEHTVEDVKTTNYVSVSPVHSVTTVRPLVAANHAIASVVKTQTVPVVQKHVQIQTQKGLIDNFVQNIGTFLPQTPSLPSFPSFPSIPSLPFFGGSTTTLAPEVEVSSPASSVITETVKDTLAVKTPLLVNDHFSKASVTAANEYVQPTDANGGYIY